MNTDPSGKPLMPIVVERIAARMAALGLTPTEVARRANRDLSIVRDILVGRNQNVSIGLLQDIARILQCSLAYLLGEVDTANGTGGSLTPVKAIPIIATAEDALRPRLDFAAGIPMPTKAVVHGPWYDQFPEIQPVGIEVRDLSMNRADPPLLPGYIALGVPMLDAGLVVESNNIYAVYFVEGDRGYFLLRRARVFADRVELATDSTEHFPVISVLGKLSTDPAGGTHAYAKIFRSISPQF